ncbi:ABC transporter permease [Amycolatopsis sp. NPDC051071]|uniref:ABC transporter permease n=1 Tax=Amycolatopsis sp. NPDC051071 TaxID=3154637 RepID=UPI003429C47D
MKSWTNLTSAVRTWLDDLAVATTWRASLLKAVGFEISQHARNRLALLLVVFFIPFWLLVVHVVLPDRPLAFHSAVVDRSIDVDADQLVLVSGAINAVTLIVGFMMFTAVRRSNDFDQRLVLAGYSRPCLLLAKLIALALVAAVVSAYATVVMTFFCDPHSVWALDLSLLSSGLTYGGLGVVLGLALSTELAGMFVIIMTSLVDVMVQNPILNPAESVGVLRYLPTYGAMQSGVAATFTDSGSAGHLLLGPLWFLMFALLALAAFHRRTRNRVEHTELTSLDTPAAVVTLRSGPDGSVVLESRSGPVVVCSHLGCENPCPPPRRSITKAPAKRAPARRAATATTN